MKLRALRALRPLLVCCAVLLASLAWLAYGPCPDIDPRSCNLGQNGIWLGHKWYAGKVSEADVDALADRLVACGMRDLFFHVGPLDATGAIPSIDHQAWRRTADHLRRLMPGVRIFAWLGGLTTDRFGVAPDTIDLSNLNRRRSIVGTVSTLLFEDGFDGLHYDLELIPAGSTAFLALLDETRRAAGTHPVSVAAPILGPPDFRRCLWTPDYMRQVAWRCNQLAIMTYDTCMPTQPLYQRMLAWQVTATCDAVAPTGCRLLFGIPTYKEHTRAHDPLVEQPLPAARGVACGLLNAGDRRAYQGIAVYAEWTTDPREWRSLGALWSPQDNTLAHR